MKSKILLLALSVFCLKSSYAQTDEKNMYWAGSYEFIFSWGDVTATGSLAEPMRVDPIIRFSGFFNYQAQFHYSFKPKFGFYTGLGMRNVGFINDLNDSVRVKQRVYSLGIPLAIKIGNMEKESYLALGGEMEMFFHYKQKSFIHDSKTEVDEWLSDRTELLNPSVFAELKSSRGAFLRFKYYINDFLKADKQSLTVNGVDYPYYPTKSALYYISIGSTINYKILKSKTTNKDM
jgi:hypothetical protein